MLGRTTILLVTFALTLGFSAGTGAAIVDNDVAPATVARSPLATLGDVWGLGVEQGPSFVEGTPEAIAIDAAWTPEWEERPVEGADDALVIVDLAEVRAQLGCAGEAYGGPGMIATCVGEDGVVRTLLGDGTIGEAHEDVPPEDEDLTASATRSVRCTSDPTKYKHWRAVYAYPSDKSSRYSSVVDSLRTHMREANYILNAKAGYFGYNMDYIYRCASGTLSVASTQLPIKAADGTHANIKSALANKGYNSALAKYVVYWDSSSTYCYGDVWGDSSASSTNSNNKGPRYSTMGTGGWTEYCSIHETFHNSGAVQKDAPHDDGGWHCTDGTDWMCYSQYNNKVCTTGRILDCRADDYCHPGSPASSNYLYNHWNACHSRHSFFYKAAK